MKIRIHKQQRISTPSCRPIFTAFLIRVFRFPFSNWTSCSASPAPCPSFQIFRRPLAPLPALPQHGIRSLQVASLRGHCFLIYLLRGKSFVPTPMWGSGPYLSKQPFGVVPTRQPFARQILHPLPSSPSTFSQFGCWGVPYLVKRQRYEHRVYQALGTD